MATGQTDTMTADEIEDQVLAKIPTLTVAELEEVCTAISLVVPQESKGKKRELRKLLSAELMKDSEDNNLATIMMIRDHLFPQSKLGENVKTENATDQESNTLALNADIGRGRQTMGLEDSS